MANGKIRFGKQSGGQLALVIPDGIDNTEIIVPESGVLATEDYVDNNSDIGAITSYSQISGTNTIEGVELTNSIHNVFNDGSAVATYQLNGNANDLGGTYNGTASNVTYEVGKFGQAAKFNGSTSKILINYRPTINDLGSISAHIKISSGKEYQTIFSAGETHPSNPVAYPYYPWVSFVVINNVLQAFYLMAGGTQTRIVSSITLEVGVEYHVAVNLSKNAFDAADFDLYINGVKDIYATRTNGVGIDQQVGTCIIGKDSGTISTISYFNGSIDQVRMFNRALTAQEVNTLYSETLVSADAVLNINQGTFIYPKGLTPRGYAKSSDTFTGAVPTSGVSNGWKYIAKDENNNFSFYSTKPTLGKTSAELYLKDGKLYNSSDDTEITPISFLSNKVRFASGVPQELAPNGIAKSVTDTIEAKEVFGKNACTAWAFVDNSGAIPIIKDGYGFSSVIRTATGTCEVYPEVNFSDTNYGGQVTQTVGGMCDMNLKALNKVTVVTRGTGGAGANYNFTIEIKGGRN